MLPTLIFCHTLLSLGQDPASLRQAAILQAVDRVAPGVVGIETSGGTDVVGQPAAGGRPAPGVRRGTGPTTGLVVAADGWIISSAFNLANQPASVVVTVGNRRFLAKIIATDSSRMLTLLKIEATGLKVPDAVPRDEIRVGMAALALGRTLAATSDAPPSVTRPSRPMPRCRLSIMVAHWSAWMGGSWGCWYRRRLSPKVPQPVLSGTTLESASPCPWKTCGGFCPPCRKASAWPAGCSG